MAKKKSRVQMENRRQPLQSRAKESVAGILAAAAALLDEVGPDGFNTNLLAKRANVRVSTIYRYYPNKYVIIAALTRALAVRWREWTEPLYATFANPALDWRKSLRSSTQDWVHHARNEPGAVSALQAMTATPELREIHRQIYDDMCAKMMAALRERGVELGTRQLLAVTRTFIASLNTGMELYLQMNGSEADLFREELTVSMERYLGPYLEGQPAQRARADARRRGSG